jgi:glycerol-3-phosphate O-acyltransferase
MRRQVAHADTIASIASGNELVYVPCHRSTMDDLLMPYAIYSRASPCRTSPPAST